MPLMVQELGEPSECGRLGKFRSSGNLRLISFSCTQRENRKEASRYCKIPLRPRPMCVSPYLPFIASLSHSLCQPWSFRLELHPAQSHSLSSGEWWCVPSFLFHLDLTRLLCSVTCYFVQRLRCSLHNACCPRALRSQWLGCEFKDMAVISLASRCQFSVNNGHLAVLVHME